MSKIRDKKRKEYGGFQKSKSYQNILNMLTDVDKSMFTYLNAPESLRTEYLEEYAIYEGLSSVAYYKGNLYAVHCSLAGELDPNGFGDLVILRAPGVSDNKPLSKCPVLFNNSEYRPDFDLFDYALDLTECRISERSQLFYSRLFPTPIARDNAELTQIETTIKKMISGEYAPILSKKDWRSDSNNTEMALITDNSKIDKIQYINQHYDSLLKRFFDRYGQAIQNTGKLAQSLQDEIHSHDWISFIYPLEKLEYRKKFVEKCNLIYGTKMSVDFSDPWKYKLEQLRNYSARVENEGENNVEVSNESVN